MNLREAFDIMIREHDQLLVFACKPWHLDSEAEIRPFVPDVGVPADLRARGLKYVLDSGTVQELLESEKAQAATPEERLAMLLYYAEHDAFPDW